MTFFTQAAASSLALAFVLAGPTLGQALPCTWDRTASYAPGTVHNSSVGNPNLDAAGNPTWEMGHVPLGGRLGQANPWFGGTFKRNIWDSAFWATGVGAWTSKDNGGAYAGPNFFQHGFNGALVGAVPMVRWIYPGTESVDVDLTGTVTVRWNGFVTAPNANVDFAIAHASQAGVALVYSRTFTKPNRDTRIESSAPVAVSTGTLTIAPGDLLLFTLQSRDHGLTQDWIDVRDDLTIDIVEPPVTALEIARLGTPANPDALHSSVSSGPILGQSWDPVIAHTSFAPAAALDFLAVDLGPPINVATGVGTLLCTPPPSGQIFYAAPGAPFSVPVPNDCSFLGVPACSQGGSFTPGIGIELTNALDLVIGNS